MKEDLRTSQKMNIRLISFIEFTLVVIIVYLNFGIPHRKIENRIGDFKFYYLSSRLLWNW